MLNEALVKEKNIKKYKDLMKKHHPDVGTEPDEEKTKDINHAKDLGDEYFEKMFGVVQDELKSKPNPNHKPNNYEKRPTNNDSEKRPANNDYGKRPANNDYKNTTPRKENPFDRLKKDIRFNKDKKDFNKWRNKSKVY